MPRLVLAVVALLFTTEVASAQIWRRARDAARRGAERAVERQAEARARSATEAAIDGLFNAGEDAVRCVFTDDACIAGARDDGRDVVLTDADGAPVDRSGDPVTPENVGDAVVRAGGGAGAAAGGAPGEGVWANYDFVPGARVLFADDFSDDRVGDFPRRLRYERGTMEVVTWQGRPFLRGTGGDEFAIVLAETLPERFTLEFDLHDPATEGGTSFVFGDAEGFEGAYVNVGHWRGSGVWSTEDGKVSTNPIEDIEEAVVPIRIAVDGPTVKVYARERRVANVPRAELGRSDRVTVRMASRADRPIYLADVRLAAGGREMLYEQLRADGRVATRGVLFATARADLRPESTPTLLDIAQMMARHPDLRLRIEGHTDDRGAADANRALSRRRAEAVVAFLVSRGVAAGRLEAVGMGADRPAADNATPEGRRQNRRVELVVL